jgi:hypothetical protein
MPETKQYYRLALTGCYIKTKPTSPACENASVKYKSTVNTRACENASQRVQFDDKHHQTALTNNNAESIYQSKLLEDISRPAMSKKVRSMRMLCHTFGMV